jgi:hypothetical protein
MRGGTVDKVEFRKVLEEAALGDFDESRDYLGMSQIGRCPRVLWRDLTNGRQRPGFKGLVYCHEGLVHQADVVDRLRVAGIDLHRREEELIAPWDGRFRGHVDGEVEGALLEIKSLSVAGMENVRFHGPRRRDRLQVQAYMHYGGWDRALIVYKCWDTGRLWVEEVLYNEGVAGELEDKAREVLAAVDGGPRPRCTCGKCR